MDKNIFEIEFCFEDENCHDIDGEVLASYLSLLHCYCKEKKCNYSISPPEKASYRQKANFSYQKEKGTRGLSSFTVDIIESFFEGTPYETAENASKVFGKNISTFFKNLSKNTKKVKSIFLKETTETNTKIKTIEEKDFHNYIIENEDKEEKEQNILMTYGITQVEISRNGRISITDTDIKNIKKTTEYKNIVNNFSTKLVEANKQKIKENFPLYPDFDYDSNETK